MHTPRLGPAIDVIQYSYHIYCSIGSSRKNLFNPIAGAQRKKTCEICRLRIEWTIAGPAQQSNVGCQLCKYSAYLNMYDSPLFRADTVGTVAKSALSFFTSVRPLGSNLGVTLVEIVIIINMYDSLIYEKPAPCAQPLSRPCSLITANNLVQKATLL